MKAFHLLGFCFLILYSCSSPKDNRIDEIDDLLSSLHVEKTFNGNVLIAEKGTVIYEKSFGSSNFDTQKPLDESSMFNIASVSKTFTAVAVLQLVEAEKLDLNDELELYFPDFPYDSIRLINLLSHTSGLDRIQRPQIREQIYRKGLDNLGVLEVYQEVKPKAHFSPGTGYFYANTNYIILALIVEQVSGLPFHQYLEENIFEKAGMESTFLKRKRVPKSLDDQVVSYYRKEKWLTFDLQDVATLDADIADKETFGNNYGESAIHTTARDLLKYHQALQNNSLLSASTTKLMYQPFEFVNGEDYEVNSKSNYPAYSALAWKLAKDDSLGQIVFHSGGIRGGRSFFIRNIDKDQCVIMLTNNELTDHHTFTTPMRILNRLDYQKDKKSLPIVFSMEYLTHGIDSALQKYHRLDQNEDYKPLIDWDFEEIGAELMAQKDFEAAIKLFNLYSQKYPEDEFSWSLLGDAFLATGDTTNALKNFKESSKVNPDYEYAKKQIQAIE